jgi:serine/threonine-protein kinase
VTRFQREAKAASSLQHPNIVQVYDYGQSEGNYFIVMEYIEGTDLRRYLRSRGMLAVDRVIIVAHDIALGLGAAHRRQIVHRDVKPQNILVGRDGSIKLTDFGIASVYKDINDERLTTTGMTLGTVQYYAPEQAQGEIVNPAADVYALGIVMYEMLTGRTPFDGDTPVAVAMQHIQDVPTVPSQFNPNIPPALEAIIMRCLEKIPEMRYRDGNALARAIEALSGEDGGGGALASTSATGSAEINGSGFTGNRSGNTPPDQRTTLPSDNHLGGQHSPANNSVSPVQDSGDVSRAETSNGSWAGGYPQSSADAITQMHQPAGSYNASPGVNSGSTLPLPKGNIGWQKEPGEFRVVTLITILILVATFLLIGFSVYLLGALGFIPLPGVQPPSAVPAVQHTPTRSIQTTSTAQPTSQQTPDGTSTPAQAPTPTPTRVPTPTPTPKPSPLPTPTPTPTPTATPILPPLSPTPPIP